MTDGRPVLLSGLVGLLIVSTLSAAFSGEVFRILEDNVTDVTSNTTTATTTTTITNNIIIVNNNPNPNNKNSNNSSSSSSSSSSTTTVAASINNNERNIPTHSPAINNKNCNSTNINTTITNNNGDSNNENEYKDVEIIVVREDDSDNDVAENEIITKADSGGETDDDDDDDGTDAGDNVDGHDWQNDISDANSKSGYIIVTYDYGNNAAANNNKGITRDQGDRNNNNNDSYNINGESNKIGIGNNNNNNGIINGDSRNASESSNNNGSELNNNRRKHKNHKKDNNTSERTTKKTKKNIINSLDEIISINYNNNNNHVSSSNHSNSKNDIRSDNNRTDHTNNGGSYNNYNNINSIESGSSDSGRGKINHDTNVNNYGNKGDTSFSKRINWRRRKNRSINKHSVDVSNFAAANGAAAVVGTSNKSFIINVGNNRDVNRGVGKNVKTKRALQFQATQGYNESNNCDGAPPLHGQDLALKKILCEYEAFIQTVMKCRNIPAVSVAMVKNGEVLLSKGFGLADREKGIRNDKNIKFFIGSVTKGFTSTLLAKLLSDTTNITWDTPVKEYIKDFQFTDEERTNHMTLKDMLSHRTGMPGYFQPLMYGFPKNITRAQFSRMIRYQPALGIFRNTFSYNNYMYVLAAHIAERITNKTWEEMIKDYIFIPLGMKNSGFSDQTEFNESFAMPYVTVHGKLKKIGMEAVRSIYPAGPAGSIYTTPTDMIKWIKFHLEQNSSGNSLGIHPERLKDTYKSISPKPVLEDDLTKPKFPIDDVFVSYNMGWISSVYRGYNRLWHSGLIAPYSSMLCFFPDVNAGIFVAINGPFGTNHHYGLKSLVWRGSDILLGEKPWLNTSTACSYPKPWYTIPKTSPVLPKKTVHLNRPAKDFLGLFCHRGFGNITVILNQTSQKLNIHFGRYGKLSMRSVGKNEFIAKYFGSLWFLTDSDYNNSTITVKFLENSENEIDSILFPVGNNLVPFVKDMKEPVYVSVTMKMATCSAVKQSVPQKLLLFFTAIFCCAVSLFLSGIQPGIAIS